MHRLDKIGYMGWSRWEWDTYTYTYCPRVLGLAKDTIRLLRVSDSGMHISLEKTRLDGWDWNLRLLDCLPSDNWNENEIFS